MLLRGERAAQGDRIAVDSIPWLVDVLFLSCTTIIKRCIPPRHSTIYVQGATCCILRARACAPCTDGSTSSTKSHPPPSRRRPSRRADASGRAHPASYPCLGLAPSPSHAPVHARALGLEGHGSPIPGRGGACRALAHVPESIGRLCRVASPSPCGRRPCDRGRGLAGLGRRGRHGRHGRHGLALPPSPSVGEYACRTQRVGLCPRGASTRESRTCPLWPAVSYRSRHIARKERKGDGVLSLTSSNVVSAVMERIRRSASRKSSIRCRRFRSARRSSSALACARRSWICRQLRCLATAALGSRA